MYIDVLKIFMYKNIDFIGAISPLGTKTNRIEKVSGSGLKRGRDGINFHYMFLFIFPIYYSEEVIDIGIKRNRYLSITGFQIYVIQRISY
jgi:hypothetical protein